MIRLLITGQGGFIGSHLLRKAVVDGDFQCPDFPRGLFEQPEELRAVLSQADAVIHLAGLSRHPDGDFLYRTNLELTRKLIEYSPASLRIYFASTTHIQKDLPYHRSKRDSAELLNQRGNAGILLMANTFGPGSRPFYNSVVSTFCKMAAGDRTPEKLDDVLLPLIGVDDLCKAILNAVRSGELGEITIPETFTIPLPELWSMLQQWKTGGFPVLRNRFEFQLYETFLSYRKERLF